jgi:hypothetical protein
MRVRFTFFALLLCISASAQTEFSLYRLNANLPQANMLNPAFAPNSKVIIGLPVISSIYLSADTDGISFRDVFRSSEGDSLKLDTLTLFQKLKPSNRIQAKESLQLFYFGLRGKKGYFSLGLHHVMEMRFNYPGDLIGWAIRGPGDFHYSGKPLDFSNFYARGVAYNKASISYGRDITPKLRVGARFNYLLGIASAESTKVSGTLMMGTDSVSLNTGTMEFQTAGVDFFDQSDLGVNDFKNYFLNTKNKGIALDFGATYDLTKNLTLSAAVNDLGYISWKEYTRSYQIAPINYTFRGFDLLDYVNQNGGEFLEAELDSLENLVSTSETTGQTFKTSLIGKFYAGANFRILKVNNFSALFYLDLFQKKINPAISLGYNLQLGRFLNTTVGITYQNGRINNVGAGIALKLTQFQFYATSDRASSFVYPARASRADAHFGMNLVFGKPKKKEKPADKKEDEEKEKKEEPVEKVAEQLPDTLKQEPVQVMETKPDTTQLEVATQQPVAPEIVKDTTRFEPQQQVIITEPIVVEDPPVKVTEPVAAPKEPRHEIVKRGSHPDELALSHYVIVGTFRSKENAQRYSNELFDAGYANHFGYVSEKHVYYVHVFKSTNLDETREIRNRFRKLNSFQFAESWVLTME